MGSQLARGLGVPTRTVSSLASVMRQELDARAAELAAAGSDPAADGPAVPIFKFDQAKAPAPSDDPISSDSAMAAGQWPRCCLSLPRRVLALLAVAGTAPIAAARGKGAGYRWAFRCRGAAAAVLRLQCTTGRARLRGSVPWESHWNQPAELHLLLLYLLTFSPLLPTSPELGGLGAGGGLLSTLISTLESVGSMGSADGVDEGAGPGATNAARGSGAAAGAARGNGSSGGGRLPQGGDGAATAAAAAAAAEAAALAAASLSMGSGSVPSSMVASADVASVLSMDDDQDDAGAVNSDDDAVGPGGSEQSAAAASRRR